MMAGETVTHGTGIAPDTHADREPHTEESPPA